MLTVPLLLLNFVAFHTFNISAGAIDPKLVGKPSFDASMRLTNDVGVDGVVFEVGGCGEYSDSILILRSSAPA